MIEMNFSLPHLLLLIKGDEKNWEVMQVVIIESQPNSTCLESFPTSNNVFCLACIWLCLVAPCNTKAGGPNTKQNNNKKTTTL